MVTTGACSVFSFRQVFSTALAHWRGISGRNSRDLFISPSLLESSQSGKKCIGTISVLSYFVKVRAFKNTFLRTNHCVSAKTSRRDRWYLQERAAQPRNSGLKPHYCPNRPARASHRRAIIYRYCGVYIKGPRLAVELYWLNFLSTAETKEDKATVSGKTYVSWSYGYNRNTENVFPLDYLSLVADFPVISYSFKFSFITEKQ